MKMMSTLIACAVAFAPAPVVHAAAPDQSERVRELRAKSRVQSPFEKIDRAMRRSSKDHEFTFFVVCLPEDQANATKTHALWTKNNELVQTQQSPVYFLQGDDAKRMVEDTANTRFPTVLAFRYGTLMHARSGMMDEDIRDAFLDIAFDRQLPKTYSADQFGSIFQLMQREISQGKHAQAADTAADILLMTTGMMNLDRFSASYPPEEAVGLSTWYHQALIGCSRLDLKDPAVIDILEGVRHASMSSWKSGENPSVLGLWVDMSFFLNHDDEIIAWIDEGTDSPRVKEVLHETFGDMVGFLAEHQRWDALANAIESSESIQGQLKGSQMIVEMYTDWNNPEKVDREIRSQIRESALCHAALLKAGRTKEAWQVAKLMRAYMPKTQTNAAICLAAHDVGVVTRAHHEIVMKLGADEYASLQNIYHGYQTRASVPTD